MLRVKITTTTQVNKGKTSFNFVLEPAAGSIKDSLLSPDDPRFQVAYALRGMIKDGTAKAVEEEASTASTPNGSGAF